MKKERKNNLDEMKEQQLLHIEKNGCWIAFWGLFIVMQIQTFTEGEFLGKQSMGEWLVFMILALYLVIACIRRGIWSRNLKPNATTNLIASLIAGAVIGVAFGIKSYIDYEKLAGAIATGIVIFIGIFFSCFITLILSAAILKKRNAKLENEEDASNDRDAE